MATFSVHTLLKLSILNLAFSWAQTINYDVLGGERNFPDPTLLTQDGVTYVFGTSDGAGNNIPFTSNSNFGSGEGWADISDAFPVANVPAYGDGGWAVEGTSWAPDINHLTDFDGSFAMYYSPAQKSSPSIHCLGLARSLNIEGPYNDSSTAPFICPAEDGGAIDAAGFLNPADNQRYVVYKIDGPAVNGGGYCADPSNVVANTSLMLQAVQSDGYTTIGGPVVLYNNQGESDQYNIEAPVIRRSEEGVYFLFFSVGCFSTDTYREEYVSSTGSVLGPYGARGSLVKTGDFGLFGPGGADVDGEGRLVLHSLTGSNDISKGRPLDTGRIALEGRTARVV